MPLKGFKCNKGQFSFDHCLSKCHECMPRFMLDSIVGFNDNDYHAGKVITATSLLGCLREIYLQRKIDYYLQPKDLFYTWRGSLIHQLFERPSLDYLLSEVRISRDLKSLVISGQLDAYDTKTDTLYDIKTIKDEGLQFIAKNGCKESHRVQVSIYAWIMAEYYHKQPKDVKICYYSMSDFVITGQQNTLRLKLRHVPKISKETNVANVVDTGKITYDKKKELLVTYDTPAVKVMTQEEVEAFIHPKALVLQEAFEKDIVPPKCDEETQKWKCASYCGMKHLCDEIESKRTVVL